MNKNEDANGYLIMTTKNGVTKKTKLKEFENIEEMA